MRIAILNALGRPWGGAGSYLRMVIPALVQRDHDIGFLHEIGDPPAGDPFALPAGSPSWSVEQSGVAQALEALSAWRPDVLVSHGLASPEVEARALQIAPAVFHAHAYYGTCISGAKMFRLPANMPCSRRFGWPCLVNYYPRRCGGVNPVTMVREFRRQAARLDLLPRFKAIVVYSAHLRDEFARHGFDATCVGPPAEPVPGSAAAAGHRNIHDRCRLLFVGRMDRLKGGDYLIDALPHVAAVLNRSIHVTFAGDGPLHSSWQAAADNVTARDRRLRIEFAGWLTRDQIDALFANADLLVVPSLWPEPYGLVGLEAASRRLPVAAFAVGGIRDWLRPGVNGYLAPGDPPTREGLAGAIIACLKDPETYACLCEGAARIAAEFDFERHMDAMIRVLQKAAGVSRDRVTTSVAHV
jgi:glycosyltransferase involved in cell wall biosynthesis